MMNPIAFLLYEILGFYNWIVIAAVISSWLVTFNVINPHNDFVRMVLRALDAMTEPVFRPIRNLLPPMGGLDLSPLVVIFIIMGLRYTILYMSRGYGI